MRYRLPAMNGVIGAELLLVLSVFVLGGLLCYLRYERHVALARLQQDYAQTVRHYLGVEDDKALLRHYYPDFVAFGRQLGTAARPRLDWIELLEQAAADIGLPALRYEIDRAVPWPGLEQGGLYRSEMRLHLGLSHEGHFLRLLERLGGHPRALSSVSECRLQAAGDVLSLQRSRTNIHASCTLHWATLATTGG